MTAFAQLRLKASEFFIWCAVVVMAPREGEIYARWMRHASREAWAPAWESERHYDKWR